MIDHVVIKFNHAWPDDDKEGSRYIKKNQRLISPEQSRSEITKILIKKWPNFVKGIG